MRVTVGLYLDGQEPVSTDHIGQPRLGPLGLLDLLEARLGLRYPAPPSANRVIDARRALNDCFAGPDAQETFGAESFRKDPLAVAEVLLRWRDALVLAGWDRRQRNFSHQRLRLIAELDARLDPRLCRSEGDRLMAILAATRTRRHGLQSVVVADPEEHWPPLWRRLFPWVNATFADEPEIDEAANALGEFKRSLKDPNRRVTLGDDRTLVVLTADSELTLARVAAEFIREDHSAGFSTLMIGGNEDVLVDRALGAIDLPQMGLDVLSTARAIPQVLALALRLRWTPLDPQHLLDFLTHPVCPVEGVLRRELARALHEAPALGGPKWKEAIQRARQKARNRAATDSRDPAEVVQRIDRDLAEWVDVERFDRSNSAPGAPLADTCARVSAWAARRGGAAEETSVESVHFLSLARAASELAFTLHGLEQVTQPELGRLIELAIGKGCAGTLCIGECGRTRYARHPGAVLDPVDTILWWDATEPSARVTPRWSTAERHELAGMGIDVPEPAMELAREAATWRRAVLAAGRRLIWFQPRQRDGERVTEHPLISRLRASLPGEHSLPVWDLDQAMTRPGMMPVPGVCSFEPIALPRARRWWRLPAGTPLPVGRTESFSSLEKFLFSPHQWVLRYAARLEAGFLGRDRLECDQRLKGNLIHRLTEELFHSQPPVGRGWAAVPENAVGEWVKARWDRLLNEEGATLLVPGHRSENAQLQHEAFRALEDLVRRLRDWRVETAVANHEPAPRAFAGGTISGRIDLLVERADGTMAVIDFKYGGGRDKREQLATGRPLQLAIYAHLVARGRDAYPVGAFYILGTRLPLTGQGGFFKGVPEVSRKAGHADLREVWKEAEAIWKWRREQLDDGWIEVTTEATREMAGEEGSPASEPPFEHWKTPEGADRYSEFVGLTGFPVTA